MSNVCSCPLASSLPSVPNAGCPQDLGQIQKIVFQRIFKTGTTKNAFATQNSVELLASWTANFSANDGTKMVVTPYVEAPTTDGGDAITFGGGNETLGGVTKVIGRNPINFSAVIRSCTQDVIKALKQLQCENALGVYLLNDGGQVIGIKDGASTMPIPIQSLFVGDQMLNGLETPDSNAIQFAFKPNWSDDMVVVTPEFNPLTDLANVVA